jgi:hypothetical protein
LATTRARVFLLSPANTGGERGRMLLNPRAKFDLAARLQTEGAPLGDIYTFISGLYFRGKMAYAEAFAAPPPGVPASVVITPGAGLIPPSTIVSEENLRALAAIDIDEDEPRYREPLERDARLLFDAAGPDCLFVLLGSIATAKYMAPLLDCFGDRLVFPGEFVGRGDMSRGGLMLRCSRSGEELTYVPARGAVRHGPRPPRLPRLPR